MLKNKIMILAIGILSFGEAAGAASLYNNNGPTELPPANFKGTQYIDSKGCVYIKAGYGTRITWVPRVNRKRQIYCNPRNKPSLNAAQLAAISGEPATRVIKPVTKAKPPAAAVPAKRPVRTAAAKPAAVVVVTPTAPVPRKAQPTTTAGSGLPPHPSDVIRSQNGGVYTPQNAAPVTSVRGTSPYSRSRNRDAIRTGPQAVHPADVIKAEKAGRSSLLTTGTWGATPIVPNRVDPVHRISIYPVLIGSDITPRGDAQMAMIWTNTVPRRLVRQERARLVASATTYRVSTKLR